MRRPRVRITVGRMMLAVALAGVLLRADIVLARWGYTLVDLEYPLAVDNEPLINPVRIQGFEEGRINLEDGRVIEIVDNYGKLSTEDTAVELRIGDGGQTEIYAKRPPFTCGSCARRKTPLLRIRLFPRPYDMYSSDLVGTGRVIEEAL
jgi:hypothetical protein